MTGGGATKDTLRSLSEMQHAVGKPVSIRTFDEVGAYDENISDDGEGAFIPKLPRNEARRGARTWQKDVHIHAENRTRATKRTVQRLLHPLNRLVRNALDRETLKRTGLLQIEATSGDDIFIAGYPKSGNTWMQHLVVGLLTGMDMRLVPHSIVEGIAPDVHKTKFYRRHHTPTFFKTHHLPRPEYRRVIHLVRDGRDAMLSYYHWRAAIEGRQPDFLRMIRAGEGLFPCKWHEHTAAWLSNPHGAKIMTITYEALKQDTVRELSRLCDFSGLIREPRLIENVAQTCAFEAMRIKEKRFGWGPGSRMPKDKYFVRRGIVGSFKDEMPVEILAAFMKEAGPIMRWMGYATT